MIILANVTYLSCSASCFILKSFCPVSVFHLASCMLMSVSLCSVTFCDTFSLVFLVVFLWRNAHLRPPFMHATVDNMNWQKRTKDYSYSGGGQHRWEQSELKSLHRKQNLSQYFETDFKIKQSTKIYPKMLLINQNLFKDNCSLLKSVICERKQKVPEKKKAWQWLPLVAACSQVANPFLLIH